MKEQNRLRELLPLYDSDELTPQERRQLEEWLSVDAQARAELEAIRALHRKLETANFYEPEAHTLHRLRDRLFERIETAEHKSSWLQNIRSRGLGNLRPAFQLGFALAMLLCGVLVGRQFFARTEKVAAPMAMDLAPLLLAQQPITTAQSMYSPRLANVHKIRFDQNTNQIEIEFSTVNDVSWRGTAEDPIVRQVLAHAMREEESPGLRLRAVRAMGEAAAASTEPDDDLLDALLQLLTDDSNAGVRIKAVQALKKAIGIERVKQALIQVLLHDQNAGVRIQALEVLSNTNLADEKIEDLEAAANDTNDYIRREAGRLLQHVSSGNVQ
jgi:hypothetical protein